MKKFLCAILALALVILPVGGGAAAYGDDMVMPAAAYASASVKAAGTCGTVSWTLYNDGELNLAPTSGDEGTLDDINAYYDAPWNSYRASIVSVDMTGIIHAGSAVSYMFYWCESLAELDLSGLDTSSVTEMDFMFYGCSSLTELDLSGFDTSSVTNMRRMFWECSSLTELDLSGFDISSVTDMEGMFFDCSFLTNLNLSGFGKSSVTDMSYMFAGCSSLTELDLSSFDTSSVTDMEGMFSGCSSLTELDLSGFNTSSVTGMSHMFERCSSLTALDLSSFDTSSVTEINYMFADCSSLTTLDLSGFDILSVKYMGYMFNGCSSLNTIYASDWTNDAVNCIGSVYMFFGCENLSGAISYDSDKVDLAYANYETGYFTVSSAGMPIILEDAEIILRNTDTYYLHAEISSKFLKKTSDVEAALDALTWYSEDEEIAYATGEYSYNSNTQEVLFPLEVESTGSTTIRAQSEEGDEVSAAVTVLLYLKAGTDTNQFTHSALSWTFTNTDYKDQLWAKASSIWESICLNVNYGETAGVCHAISYTMSLGQQGLLDFDDISDGAECYADLPDPLTNSSYRDILVYYQMLQLTSAGEASQSVDNTQAWYTSSKQNRLSAFLKALVAEAKEGEDSEIPFLFGFKYNDNESGHTVVVCGYSQDDNGDHEIWIVDPNSYQSKTVLHDYLIMTVASDYSSFSFQDEIRIRAGTSLEDVWSRLEFYSIDDIYDDGVLVKTSAAAAESADTAVLKISYGNAFRLENAQGEYLAFDGENYTGDMTVYDCSTAGIEGDMYWNLTVSASSSYVLTEADADASFGFTFDGQEYVVSEDGADRVSVTANGIEASGETYNLDVYVETSAVDMVEISAEFEGDASIQYDAESDSITVTGSSDTDEVSVTYFDGANQVTEQADLSAGNLTIDAAAGKEMIEETTGDTTGSTTEGAASGTAKGAAGGSTNASTQDKTQKITIKKSALTKKIKYKKLKKKNQTFKLKATTSGDGKITYKKTSGNKKIKVSKAGKVTVKKGLKKGRTYKVKVKITAAKTSTYKKATKTVTLKIKIK